MCGEIKQQGRRRRREETHREKGCELNIGVGAGRGVKKGVILWIILGGSGISRWLAGGGGCRGDIQSTMWGIACCPPSVFLYTLSPTIIS